MAFVITEGNEGLSIIKIQEYLNELNSLYPFIPIVKIDGIYSNETINSIFTFQKETGLPANGIIDTLTWDKIITKHKAVNQTTYFNSTYSACIRYGNVGLDVQKIQGYLNLLLPTNKQIVIDGHFGIDTESKVIKFQIKNELEANGEIDDKTWNRIIELL